MEMRIVELMSAGTSPPAAVQTQAAGALQTSCKAAAAADSSAAAVSLVVRQIIDRLAAGCIENQVGERTGLKWAQAKPGKTDRNV